MSGNAGRLTDYGTPTRVGVNIVVSEQPTAQGKARSRKCRCICTYAYADTSSSLGRLQRPAGYIDTFAIGFASYADTSLCSLLRQDESPFTAPSSPCRAYCAPRPQHHRSSPTKAVSRGKIVSLASRFFTRDERLTAQRLRHIPRGSEGVGEQVPRGRWGHPRGSTGASPRTP